MKAIMIGLLTLLTFNLNAQHMKNPNDVITGLFISTDQKEWNNVKAAFDATVLLDYSSMSGNPASELTPDQIITAWKGILPGFEYTHHQIGNFRIDSSVDEAKVFCYGMASHFLTDAGGNIWTVVGSYDFKLVKNDQGNWKISAMKFNFKYQDGNTSLPQKAMDNAKESK